MKHGIAVSCLVALALWSGAAARGDESTRKELHAFFERQWDISMEASPTTASGLGDRRWNDQWEDASPEGMEKRRRQIEAALQELNRIDRAKLPPADQLNYDLFQQEYAVVAEEMKWRWYLIPLTQREGIQMADDLAESLRFETVKDFEDWLGRMERFPAYMDQTIALMREGMRARIVQPKITMQRVPGQIRKQLVAEPRQSGFFKPFTRFPAGIAEGEQARLAAAAEKGVAEWVLPAYRKFQRFFTEEYLLACFDQPGAWQVPNGPEIYKFLARKFTTTSLTPAQIHEIGQSEVRRIRAEMEKVKTQVGFAGSLTEFMDHLRSDPKYYFKTGEELLTAYRALSKEVDPLMVKVFRTLPRMPYGVEAIPDNAAPDTTTAYYRPPAADGSRAGSYFVNLYRPETRPKYEMMALSLHEAVPGHHFQIALAMEQGELPKFRRYGGYTAFIEGWGLYSEHLGDELGLYKDPYAKFGQLTYEMWRAVRLVVDTGIHEMKWDRQQAIDFFKANAAKSDNDIVNEIDRYISWPGQALAYKIGELKIKELRAAAEKKLGAKFDVKAFHNELLLAGALPLEILEKRIHRWMENQ